MILLLSGLSSCGTNKSEGQKAQPNLLRARAEVARSGPLLSSFTTTAEILPFEQVELRAPVSGTVMSIHFTEGQFVSSGSLLVQLDDRTFQAEREGVSVSLRMLRNELNRREQLRTVEGTSQEEIERLESQIGQLDSQVKLLEVQIDLCRVSAPFSGIVGMRDFSPGAFLTQGSAVTTLAQTTRLKAEFRVPEGFHEQISPGNSVFILVSGDTIRSSIFAVEPFVERDSRMIRVRSEILSPPSHLRAGTFAEALLSRSTSGTYPLVPNQSIIPSLENESVLLYKGGKVKKQVVKTGSRDYTHCEILEGISDGDTVITTGLLFLRDGADVLLDKLTDPAIER